MLNWATRALVGTDAAEPEELYARGKALRERGHDVTEIDGIFGSFGHAHLIEVTADGLAGAADPRALISAAIGY